jgi:hypothetical protein
MERNARIVSGFHPATSAGELTSRQTDRIAYTGKLGAIHSNV